MEFDFKVWDPYNREMLKLENLHFDEYHNNEMTIKTTMYTDYFTTEEMILLPYTGLKDKNGQKIYLQDILQIDETGRKLFSGVGTGLLDREYQLVGFSNGGFMTGHNHLDPETMNTYLWIVKDYATVVGNKNINPELLDKDKEYYTQWLQNQQGGII